MEATIQKQVLGWLKLHGFWHRRVPIGAVGHGGIRKKNPLKGFPDIIGIIPKSGGRLFAIEVKDIKGKISKDQAEVMAELNTEGVLVIVARSLFDVSGKLLPFKSK